MTWGHVGSTFQIIYIYMTCNRKLHARIKISNQTQSSNFPTVLLEQGGYLLAKLFSVGTRQFQSLAPSHSGLPIDELLRIHPSR